VVTRGNENCEHATRACSQFLRARVRSFEKAALLALPSRVLAYPVLVSRCLASVRMSPRVTDKDRLRKSLD